MYEAFYGLRARPFSILPDPGFLFFSRKHKVALDLLEYGLSQAAGFCVVTGPIGTGKTTLIRYLLGSAGRDTQVGLIANMHAVGGSLLPRVLYAFGLEVKAASDLERLQVFSRFLEELAGEGRRAVLIVDEAQSLSAEMLEELRMLSNVNMDTAVLQVVLVGQPALRDMLRRPELEQLAQRVVVDYELQPLDGRETEQYIAHRIRVAGAQAPSIFGEDACAAVHHYSRGVPRVINVLCETALVYGFGDQKPGIDAQVIHDVAGDRQRSGIFPLRGSVTAV
ncbi:MAG: AAA family ATPase [Prolixibacteraceae bacterium]|nr:AAA family ATPase [Burkholderiales bacterium]